MRLVSWRIPMAIAEKDPGIVRIASRYGVPETVDRLERLLKERGLVVFARVDFSGDAARAGLKMRAEQALIFGNPKAGTPLMQAVPTSGLGLPFRGLGWGGAGRKSWVSFTPPGNSIQRHRPPPALRANPA